MENFGKKFIQYLHNSSDVSFIKLSEVEARLLRINLIESNSEESFGISIVK